MPYVQYIATAFHPVDLSYYIIAGYFSVYSMSTCLQYSNSRDAERALTLRIYSLVWLIVH